MKNICDILHASKLVKCRWNMKPVCLKNVKKGEYITLTHRVKCNEDCEVLSKYVWIKGDYDRSTHKYEIYRFDNICDYRYYRGDKIVWIDFMF